MAKTKKKISKKSTVKGARAFNIKFNKIRDQIDSIAQSVLAAKKYGGRIGDNAKEQGHADEMLNALVKAKAYVQSQCCHNDQSCTLFMMKAKSSR